MERSLPTLDLDACANEPIHIPGAIQPHGALLAVDEDSLVVALASTNVASFLGVSHADIIGMPLATLFEPPFATQLADLQGSTSFGRINPLHVARAGQDFEAVLHRSGGLIVMEIERQSYPEDTLRLFYALARDALVRMQESRSQSELWPVVVSEVRRITGFDRVMIYSFDEKDGHGEVIAESMEPAVGWESYLGLHYPASDVPAQARHLYTVSWLRLIADVDYAPVAVLPTDNPRNGQPFDMSFSVLRSVSPVHIEYLKNMGVGASMSISLIQDERLWGLIACHHRTVRVVPYRTRLACELIGQVCSWLLDPIARSEAAGYRIHAAEVHARLIERVADESASPVALLYGDPCLLDLVPADGAAVAYEGQIQTRGETPSEGQIAQIIQALQERKSASVLATDDLSAEMPFAKVFSRVASGLLAVPLSEDPGEYALWFRAERIQSVRWGGNPGKPASIDPSLGRIHPRKSFAVWEETVRGRAVTWSEQEREAARALRMGVIGVVLRKAAEVKKLNVSLKAALRSRDDFLSIASHELRTPITTLGVQISAMRRACERDNVDIAKLRSRIDVAGRQVDRLEHLVGELLDVARISAGRLSLEITDVDLVQVAYSVVERFEETAPPAGTTITIDAPEPVLGRWDETRLDQVITNLLSNAIKYGRGAPVVVQIKAERDQAVLRVKDHGPGIAEEAKERIFERFERITTPRAHYGVGLGLWIVRQIVLRHGGSISVESRKGEGATFVVALPFGDSK